MLHCCQCTGDSPAVTHVCTYLCVYVYAYLFGAATTDGILTWCCDHRVGNQVVPAVPASSQDHHARSWLGGHPLAAGVHVFECAFVYVCVCVLFVHAPVVFVFIPITHCWHANTAHCSMLLGISAEHSGCRWLANQLQVLLHIAARMFKLAKCSAPCTLLS